MAKKVKLHWYYHDSSDSIFPDEEGVDFGNENEFIKDIGEYVTGTVEEVRALLKNSNLFLLDTPDLKKLITNDIEQY